MPFVTPTDYANYRKHANSSIRSLSTEGLSRLRKKILPPQSIMVTCIGSDMGKVVMNSLEVVTNQQINSIIPNKMKVNNDFLYYSIVNMHDTLRLYGGDGTAVPILNKKDFGDLVLSLPPLPEQKAIAAVLSSLDDKIDLLHRQNKTLEAMAETLFRQWFIEEAEDDWTRCRIGDFEVIVTDYVSNGSFASLKENVTYYDSPNYAILIRTKDYNAGFKGNFVYVDERAYTFLKKSTLRGGEVIISNVGEPGIVFRCPKLYKPMTLGPNSIVLISNFNNYFYLFFKSNLGQSLIESIISGSVQSKFNKTAFRNLEITFPCLSYILKFEELTKPIFNKIDSNQQQIIKMTHIREYIPKLISVIR